MAPLDPATLPELTINFEYGDTEHPGCARGPLELYTQFTAPNPNFDGYGVLEVNVSAIVIPADVEAGWWGTPASYWMRQKVRRAIKLGYTFGDYVHNDHIDDIHAINVSLEERQGRPMTESYRERPGPSSPLGDQPCPRHRIRLCGVFKDERLYAYAIVRQCGEMLLFSRILGHGAHMQDGIMQLLVYEATKQLHERSGTQYAVYHLQDSGTEGLQFFKRKMGFSGYRVHWELARAGVEIPDGVLS